MKVSLIFPPDWNHLWMPYGSTSAVKAYLGEAGIDARQFDFNIEAYERILKPEELKRLYEQTDWKKDLSAPVPGAPGRREVGKMLADKIDLITGDISEALEVFRSSDKFYDVEKYRRALDVLDGAVLLVSAASWALEEALKSPTEAIKAALDPSVNIFYPYMEEIFKEKLAARYEMVGISVAWPRQMIPAIALASLVKKKYPDTHVTLGGSYPSMISEAMENSPELFDYFDSVALSEGEVASLGLAKAIAEGESVSEVPGILYRHGGEVKRTSLPVMEDADELPTPDFEGLDLGKYLSPEPVLPVFSSRGCFWRRCTYCLRPDRKTFSQRSPQQVVKDLTSLHRHYQARVFHFTDNAIRARRMAEIADGIAEAGLEISWTARTRFSHEMTWDWCDQVAGGGCARIIFGVESASKRILDMMDKGFRTEDVQEIIQGLSKAGIDSTLYFIVGFPTEREEEARKTMQFAEKLTESLTPYAQYHTTLFAVPRGSVIHQKPENYGIAALPQSAPNDLRNPFFYNFETKEGMSREEAVKMYGAFMNKFGELTKHPFRMPHDMLMRMSETAEKTPSERKARILKLEHIPTLADDLRAEKGYLLKGGKRFRIDGQLRKLMDLLDSKRTVRQLLKDLTESEDISMPAAYIYAQQLYDEGIIEVRGPEEKKGKR